MSEFGGTRSTTRAWNYYPSTEQIQAQLSSPPQVTQSYNYKQDGPWKNFGGTTSINAISFGFVATAILISMFLIMAILEHLFRTSNDPSLSPTSPSRDGVSSLESGSAAKSTNHRNNMVLTTYARDCSVVMPGQKYPTCIAQPAPLLPCPREGFRWHSRDPTFPC